MFSRKRVGRYTSMEAGTAIRIQPLWLWLCGDGPVLPTHFLLAPGDRSAAARDLLPTGLVQEEKEPDILNSSTDSKRSELSIETVSRQRDKHRLYPRLTNIVRLSNYVARIHSSPVASNYQRTEVYKNPQYHAKAPRFRALHVL